MSDRRETSFDARRRNFLFTLGLAAGAVAAAPVGQLFGRPRSGDERAGRDGEIGRMPRIGILLPGAAKSHYSGEHFTAGFTCYLDHLKQSAGVTTSLVCEDYAHTPHQALKAAEAMIASGKIDVLVAALNADIAARLHGALEEHKIIFINVDAGANVVREREQSPYLFHSSLSHWQANMALGRHAVGQYGSTVMIASSLYESGYDALYAFRLGVEEAGGTVRETHVTHGSSPAEDMKAVVEQIRQVHPDVVCALYHGAEAEAFVKMYAKSGLSRQIPLIASAFTLDEAILRGQGSAIAGVRSCRCWSRAIESDENAAFVARYTAHAHHEPDAFSVLGYDTARLIAEAVRAAGGETTAGALCDALPAVRFEGPRGTIAMDARTRSVVTPVYLCAARGDRSTASHDVVQKIEARQDVSPAVAALEHASRSGFSNSYLTA